MEMVLLLMMKMRGKLKRNAAKEDSPEFTLSIFENPIDSTISEGTKERNNL